ncbi:hypothetical protein F0Q45_20565 [Mycobacterium simiae]|uniref:Uncharacterized protein n=1 Tax=Mycobacterium simiae TaxID=1784 RepID=A0A5B1BIG4_MYCSI|nr:hypothetical protein [Mycobacterium simiae]KAA1248448.1 hypothetical protein F0Q45_20565 [Mycobacterium simiae]
MQRWVGRPPWRWSQRSDRDAGEARAHQRHAHPDVGAARGTCATAVAARLDAYTIPLVAADASRKH